MDLEARPIGRAILAPLQLAGTAELGVNTIIGAPRRRLAVKYADDPKGALLRDRTVRIGERTWVGHNTLIYEGTEIGDDCFVDDGCRVGAYSSIGNGTMLLYGCAIYEEVVIGQDCRIAGFIPSGVRIGNNVTMMGTVAHKYDRPLNWFRDEPSPHFEDDCVIGLNATIVGGITIGRNSYVAAHALITKDVPANSFAYKFNEIMPLDEFERLKRDRQAIPT